MNIRYKVENLEVEVEGSDVKQCMAEVSSALEVFGNNVCGACNSTKTVPSVREAGGSKFFEMRCLSCGAALGFGQKKADGSLFPRRKDKNDSYLPNNGWTKWQPKATADEAF